MSEGTVFTVICIAALFLLVFVGAEFHWGSILPRKKVDVNGITPYLPDSFDEAQEYEKADVSLKGVIQSFKDSTLVYDPVQDEFVSQYVLYDGYMGEHRCPDVVARFAVVALTPVISDIYNTPTERRREAYKTLLKIYRWRRGTRQAMKDALAYEPEPASA